MFKIEGSSFTREFKFAEEGELQKVQVDVDILIVAYNALSIKNLGQNKLYDAAKIALKYKDLSLACNLASRLKDRAKAANIFVKSALLLTKVEDIELIAKEVASIHKPVDKHFKMEYAALLKFRSEKAKSKNVKNSLDILTNDISEIKYHLMVSLRHIRDNRIETDRSRVHSKLKKTKDGYPLSIGEYFGKELSPGPLKEVEGYDKGLFGIGVASFQGYNKPIKEDLHLTEIVTIKFKEGKKEIGVFAVFDGHGGIASAMFCKNNLSFQLEKYLNNKSSTNKVDIWNALKLFTLNLDHDFHKRNPKDSSGTTLCLCVIIDNILWTLNIGDSRAVLGTEKNVVQLTKDQETKDISLIESIEKRGGIVFKLDHENTPRLYGETGMARSLGEYLLKDLSGQFTWKLPGFFARGKVGRYNLKKMQKSEKMILCLGTDGYWGYFGSKDTMNYILNNVPNYEKKFIAENMLLDACKMGSSDDKTLLIVDLKKYVNSVALV